MILSDQVATPEALLFTVWVPAFGPDRVKTTEAPDAYADPDSAVTVIGTVDLFA